MIQERAMLAAVHISIWTAVKHDRGVSRDVAERNGAPMSAGRYNKQLLRGADKLDELRTLAGQVRQYFYKITLPWTDEGYRLLPANIYFDLTARMREFEASFAQGVEWKLKMGAEPQAETAATRLLWAAGYFVDEDYYAPEVKVEALPKLKRGGKFEGDGVLRGVRLERKIKGQKNVGTWDWFQNPFLNTREFNGLRVMMSMLNNWDLKQINNSVYEVDGETRYVVSDVGATFGKTGDPLTRSKSDLKGYEKSKFIEKEKGGYIDFTLHSRPPLIGAINAPNYKERTQMEKVTQHIPHDDARWLGERLSHLSDEQIRDCFHSAGYTRDEVEEYTRVIKDRIAALNAL